MFIKKIEIKNFRNYQKTDNFAGENGCGKTNLLDAIALSLLEYKWVKFRKIFDGSNAT